MGQGVGGEDSYVILSMRCQRIPLKHGTVYLHQPLPFEHCAQNSSITEVHTTQYSSLHNTVFYSMP